MSPCRAWESGCLMRSFRSTVGDMTYVVECCDVFCSTMGSRFFKWKMLRESGSYVLLFLQLLIALVT